MAFSSGSYSESTFSAEAGGGGGGPPPPPANIYEEALESSLETKSLPGLWYELTLSDDTTVSSEGSAAPGAVLTQALGVTPSLSTGMTAHVDVLSQVRVSSPAKAAYVALLAAALQVTSSFEEAFRRTGALSSGLQVSTETLAGWTSSATLATAMALDDSIGAAYPGDLDSQLGLTVQLSERIKAYQVLLNALSISSLTEESINGAAVAVSSLGVSSGLSISQVLSAVVHDQAQMLVAFGLDDVLYTGWVMNTRNLGVTEYTNYPFNSFAYDGQRRLAASAQGVYELGAENDDGTNIDAMLKTPLTDFGTPHMKRFYAAYLGVRSNGEIMLKATTAEQVERWYTLKTVDSGAHEARVKHGKGVKSVYWQFEITNTNGANIDLDFVDLYPLVLSRRL